MVGHLIILPYFAKWVQIFGICDSHILIAHSVAWLYSLVRFDVAGRLRMMDLMFMLSKGNPANLVPPIDLSHDTNLTTLTINCASLEDKGARRYRHRMLPVLQTISSKALLLLTIILGYQAEYDESVLEVLDWTEIARALAQVTSSCRSMEPIIIFPLWVRWRKNE